MKRVLSLLLLFALALSVPALAEAIIALAKGAG